MLFARTILSLVITSRTEALQKPLRGIQSNGATTEAITEANSETRRKYVLVIRAVGSPSSGEEGFWQSKEKSNTVNKLITDYTAAFCYIKTLLHSTAVGLEIFGFCWVPNGWESQGLETECGFTEKISPSVPLHLLKEDKCVHLSFSSLRENILKLSKTEGLEKAWWQRQCYMPSTNKEIPCWPSRNVYSISKLLQAFGLTPVRKTKIKASYCQGQPAIKSFPDIKYESKGMDSKSLSSKLKSWNWNKKLNIYYFKNRQNDASDL